jgi:DNA-binding SARP family transcriptional activator
VVEVRLLGPVEVTVGGQRVTPRRRQERCLLAILAMEPGRLVSVDRLIELLWGGHPPRRARTAIQAMVSHLRSALRGADGSGPRLVMRGSGYALEVDDDAVDAHRFRLLLERGRAAASPRDRVELLQAALGLWRGPALADATTEADRPRLCGELEELQLAAREEWLQARLDCGEHTQLIDPLTRLIDDHPLREHPRGLLMLALYRSGRRGEALEVYRKTRQVLIDELGLGPGPELRRLEQAILNDDPSLLADQQAPAAAPAAAVPAHLPADVAAFTGRVEHLEELDALLDRADQRPGSVIITAIGGTAGVGKTALAVHWAHRVAGRFPDGQLYVNLRGFDPAGSAAGPDTVLRGFLDALAVPLEQIPEELEAKVGLYRSLLADKRMLVVLDNARDAEQVRPLLPAAPSCLVVVTSRSRLSGLVAAEGAYPLMLDVLSQAEARQLLARRIGAGRVAAEPAAVDAIIARCARLPLALAVAAARAATNPGFPLAVLTRELNETRYGLDSFAGDDAYTDVRAVFSWSYRTLSTDAARLFRLLGLLPGPDVGTAAVASLAGVTVSRVRQLLAELTRSHLLAEHQPGRYSFHDLLRAYASELVHAEESDTDRQAATQRIFDHYLHTSNAAALVLHPYREVVDLPPAQPGVRPEKLTERPAALAWFNTEHAVLIAAMEQAPAVGLDSYTWRLAFTLATHLMLRGDNHAWAATMEPVLDSALRLGDRLVEGQAAHNLARAYVRLGRDEAAEQLLRRALDLYRAIGDQARQARAHVTFGRVRAAQHRLTEALEHHQRALELFTAAGHRAGQADALNALGWTNGLLGDFPLALKYCARAIPLHQEVGDRWGEAATWDSLGYAHLQLKQYPQAFDCLQRSIALCRLLGDRWAEAMTLTRLGDAYQAAGDRVGARASWTAAVTILDQLDDSAAAKVRGKLHDLERLPALAK